MIAVDKNPIPDRVDEMIRGGSYFTISSGSAMLANFS